MDQLRKMKQHGELVRSKAESSNGTGVVPFKWESQPGKPKPPKRPEHSGDEGEAHEPRVVQLNLKASLMGVHILDDDEELFFSRQSSMSSMISDKFRSVGAVPFKWEAEPGKAIDPPKKKVDTVMPLMPPPGSRSQSGVLYSQPLAENSGRPQSGMLFPAGGSKAPSGMLYPFQHSGSRANSSMLNAAHFTFGDIALGPEVSTSGGNNLTEKIFKKLVGQSRLQQSNNKGGESSGNNLETQSDHFDVAEDESDSPVSTLDLPVSRPASPASSERSFRHKSTRNSLRRRSEDATSVGAAQLGPIDPNAPRPKSQLAQYLMSITAMSDDGTDEDDIILEGPSEFEWHQPDDQQYHPQLPVVEGYVSSHGKPTHERWTSNSSSWNLSLVQKPLKTVSTIVKGSKHLQATVPDSGRLGSRRDKDAIMPISLTSSYDGGSRGGKRAVRSEFNSGRSRRPESDSGRNRLHIEVVDEPDLDEPDMEQANNVNRLQQDGWSERVDEEDFPFDTPIASSFVFGEADKKRLPDAQQPGTRSSTLSKAVVDSEDEDLHLSDKYHDPDVGSITDSEESPKFSLHREGKAVLDQPPQWVPTRSFNYVKEVVGSISRSSRALSGFLEIVGSGRFSVDLQRGPRLDKAEPPRSPDVRLRIIKTEKPSRRSILSPCLPFLHRSNKSVPRIQAAAPAPSLQPLNSFTARLGLVAEGTTATGQFQ